MTDVALPALRGHNPLGLFAALGALDVATRALPDRRVTLRWADALEPSAVLRGPDSIEHLVALCDDDRSRWATSPVLTWGPDATPLPDLKTTPDHLRTWTAAVLATALTAPGQPSRHDRSHVDLFAALVAEGAIAGKGDTKPTHLHFTAGRQLFLAMVRELCKQVDAERLREAMAGPWRYDSPLPVLGWDVRGERLYALRGSNPANDRKLGVPGADWLGFLGLRFFPVAVRRRNAASPPELMTTGCRGSWKEGTFSWPLWDVGLTSAVVSSLMADEAIASMTRPERRELGVHHYLRSPIRRSDQGGYGSFGAPEPVLPAPPKPSSRR